jgi:hypothetical protein
MQAADHEVLRDADEMVALSPDNAAYVAYARPYRSAEFGAELALVIENLWPEAQESVVPLPLERLGIEDDRDSQRIFVLYDLLGKHAYLRTLDQLRALRQDLGPFERRLYLVREVEHPSPRLRELVTALDLRPGFGLEREGEEWRPAPRPALLPWSAAGPHPSLEAAGGSKVFALNPLLLVAAAAIGGVPALLLGSLWVATALPTLLPRHAASLHRLFEQSA